VQLCIDCIFYLIIILSVKRGISLMVKLDVTAITFVVRIYDASSIVSFIMSILNMFRIIWLNI